MGFFKRFPPLAIALCVAPVILLVGLLGFAGPCGVHDDGSVSSCLWAARAVQGVAAVCTVLGIVRLATTDAGVARGMDVALGLLAALVACVPGGLIGLCMMQTMRCHALMRPFCLALAALIALLAVADALVSARRSPAREARRAAQASGSTARA